MYNDRASFIARLSDGDNINTRGRGRRCSRSGGRLRLLIHLKGQINAECRIVWNRHPEWEVIRRESSIVVDTSSGAVLEKVGSPRIPVRLGDKIRERLKHVRIPVTILTSSTGRNNIVHDISAEAGLYRILVWPWTVYIVRLQVTEMKSICRIKCK